MENKTPEYLIVDGEVRQVTQYQQQQGKGSAPPAPDYTGAANATAAGNLEAARAATAANRVNQYTPYGNLTYSQDPNASNPDSGWSATQTLSPAQQQMLDQSNNLSNGLLGTAQTGLNYVDQALSNGGQLDNSKLAQNPIEGKSVQDAIMSRLQPQLQADRTALDAKLANQGITQGSEAYKNANRQADQQQNDLYTQAALQGINTGLAARQQGIQEQYTAQDRPLNIVNALRTGNQVQAPSFVNVPQQQTTAGADLLGAANAQYGAQSNAYNQKVAQGNAITGGLFSLGGAALGAPTGTFAGLFSDARLKTNITRIGTHPLGIGIYSYDYIWGEFGVGVMAQELEKVMPEAVGERGGFKTVKYWMI